MKKYFLTFTLLLTAIIVFAQPGKKPVAKEKAPTQKEMEDMMKEAQKAMDEMSPEDKKMMDSMGIKMPSLKDVPKVSDKQLAEAWEDETRIVPKRSDARIASISQKVNDATMGGYLAAIQKKIAEQLMPEVKSTGDKVINYIQLNTKNSSVAGNMADAIWIAGKPALALYVMGKICTDDPLNTDNLNNYAAMLLMNNAQQLAIPILNNLNKKFPGNSTLLNNLGQAWFGLGDIPKAEKYLDSAIRIYAYHPQANLTKAAIEESRGNTAKAVEAIKKSIKHAYTNEKEDMLRKQGYKITLKDVRVPFKPGSDPLGLSGFRRPDYPTSISQLKSLGPKWEDFNSECDSRLAQLQTERKNLGDKYEKNILSLTQGVALPVHYKKASLQLEELMADYETKIKKLAAQFMVLAEELDNIQKNHKRAAPEASCNAHLQAENDFLKQYNEKKKAFDEQALEVFRHYFNDLAYWSQFTSIDKNQFNLVLLDFQTGWLQKLREYQPLLYSEFENLECAKDENAEPGKLSDFDVVHCNYNDTMDLKVITFYQNCSRMTSKLNLKFAEYTRYDNFNRSEGDTYTGSTIKVSVEKGFEELKGEVGPVKVEAKVGASIEMEFDREGIKDINLGLEAKAGAGHNLMDKGLEEEGSVGGKDLIDNTVEIGVEGRISILSG
ncbi:MAG TPA: hypothetical protein VIV35_01075, partial [Chitinophagaceae bacterium]